MMSILIFVVVLLVLILSHELGHAIAAWLSGCRVEEFGVGFPPRIFGKKIGETLVTVNWLPLGGFVKITGEDEDSPDSSTDPRSFANKPFYKKLIILLAGITMNVVLAIVIYAFIAGIGSDVSIEGLPKNIPVTNRRVEIVALQKNSVLSNSDVKKGDIILKVNEETITGAGQAASAIKNFEGKELSLQLSRGGKERSIVLSFPEKHEKGQIVGMSLLDMATYKVAWWQAPFEGVRATWRVLGMTASGFATLFNNLIVHQEVPKDIAGPVGIASLVGTIQKQGFLPLMELIAVLSVNLALINILPIPALDGGRAFFVILDAVGLNKFRGKPERLAHTVGFFLLILLVLLITINDVKRLFHP